MVQTEKGVGTIGGISHGFAVRDGSAVKSHSSYITTAPPPNLTLLLHSTASYAGFPFRYCYCRSLSNKISYDFLKLIFPHFTPYVRLSFVEIGNLNISDSKMWWRKE